MIQVCRRPVSHALIAALTLCVFGTLAGHAGAAPPSGGPIKPSTARKAIAIFPVAGTRVASDRTTISFRGIKPQNLNLHRVKVIGSRTGVHRGTKLRHSDGRGVSFVPKKKFARGEQVRVTTGLRIIGARRGDFSYRIGRFTTTDDKPLNPEVPPITDGLRSRPDLKPTTLEVLTDRPEKSPGQIFYAPKQDGLAIANADGKTTWFDPFGFARSGVTVYNFRAQKYRGRPVLTYWKGASSVTGYSQIGTFEILNRRYETIASLRPGNGYKADIHEFQLTDRDTALVLSYTGVRQDLRKAGGPKNGKLLDNVIQEIDIKTGAVLFEWHSYGNVSFTTGIGAVPTDPKTSFDYFHANSIQVDGDGYLISGRRHSTVYRVDGKTGRIKWRLAGNPLPGNTKSSFIMGEGTKFGYQHDAQRLPNGDISLFDNSNGRFEPSVLPDSSALVLRLGKNSAGKRTATLVRRYNYPAPGIIAASQGNAETLADGNMFVGWGQVPQMTEFNPAGEVVFDARHSGTVIPEQGVLSSYRIYKGPWSGIAPGKPAIASDAGTGKVYASWNGSQETARWKVVTGADTADLRVIAEVPWADFETEIDAPDLGAVVGVQAFGAAGNMIGESNVVPVGTQDSGQK
ncbi:MAG TPA: arylsulfotransferase family protein [Solirubrobacterales bacterium]|nr:arylsulfotransferase family protein [Solirubrobacterales bacterium]